MAKRDYQNDFASVTQVLGVLRKIGLENWFKYNTAQFCNAKSARGKQIGTEIHQAVQDHIELKEVKVDTEYPQEVTIALKSFMLFKKEHPEFTLKRSELPLTSEKHKYNGTLDCLAEKEGNLRLIDWKTGEAKKEDKPKIYDEHRYQASAYVEAHNELHDNKIESAFIVVLAKDKIAYTIEEITMPKIQEYFNEVFLSCLRIYNYQKKGGK